MRNETRPIDHTRHSEKRMVDRNVTREEVEMVIRSGAWQPDGTNAWIAFARIPDGREISVAFVEEPKRLLVKTVMD